MTDSIFYYILGVIFFTAVALFAAPIQRGYLKIKKMRENNIILSQQFQTGMKEHFKEEERKDLFNKLELILKARRIPEREMIEMCKRKEMEINELSELTNKQLGDIIMAYGVGVPGVGKS